MDEKTRGMWIEAEKNPEFHFSDMATAFRQPRVYGDTPSFLEARIAHDPADLEGADVVFIGFPWEGGIQLSGTMFAEGSRRPPDPDAIVQKSGAYLAPEYLRKYSVHYSLAIGGGYFPEISPDFRLVDYLNILDYRDVEVKDWDVEESTRRAVEQVGHIVRAGAVPLVFGGDHSTPYPIVKAISDNTQGKIGVINFDSHYDIGLAGRLNAGNAFGKIMQDCQAEPENLVIIGIKGGAYNTPLMHQVTQDIGATVFTIADVRRIGMLEVIGRAIEIAGKGTERIYVSLDVDSMDPATFPAQKYPDPFGLDAADVKDALLVLARDTELSGFDMVCIGPPYDHKGVGALCACRLYLEVLKGLALRKARGN